MLALVDEGGGCVSDSNIRFGDLLHALAEKTGNPALISALTDASRGQCKTI